MSEAQKDWGTLSVRRTGEGVRIYAKSDIFEPFFKNYRDPNQDLVTHPRWKGVTMYPLPLQIVNETLLLDHASLNAPGEKLLLPSGQANLTFLRHQGLSKGLSFAVGTTPVRASYLDKFLEKANKGILELYANYLRPFDVEIVFSSVRRSLSGSDAGREAGAPTPSTQI